MTASGEFGSKTSFTHFSTILYCSVTSSLSVHEMFKLRHAFWIMMAKLISLKNNKHRKTETEIGNNVSSAQNILLLNKIIFEFNQMRSFKRIYKREKKKKPNGSLPLSNP